MSDGDGERSALARLRAVADYQFGSGAGAALFPPGESLHVTYSSGGRASQVAVDRGGTDPDGGPVRDRLVSVTTDGRLTLGAAGGARLVEALPRPAARVVVGDDSEPYVREGKNVFAKFVRAVDGDVRARDEVAVVHDDGGLLAVGRAELDAAAMRAFETGMAVKNREGVPAPDSKG